MAEDNLIRRAKIGDLRDILRLNHELFKEEYRKFDKTLDLGWTYSKDGVKFFKNSILKRDRYAEVIENKGKIMGYLNGGFAKRVPWRKEAQYAYLGSIFIYKKFRNKGLGGKLIKNFIIWCKKNRVSYLSVSASAQNDQGITFYRKSGFKDYDLVLQKKI